MKNGEKLMLTAGIILGWFGLLWLLFYLAHLFIYENSWAATPAFFTGVIIMIATLICAIIGTIFLWEH
jgi:hypothetical protein